MNQAVNVKSIQNLSSDSKENRTHHGDQATRVPVPSGHGVTAADMGDATATHHRQDDAVATHHGQSLSNLHEQQPTQETETPERARSREFLLYQYRIYFVLYFHLSANEISLSLVEMFFHTKRGSKYICNQRLDSSK